MNLSKHWASLLDDYVIDLAWSPDGELLAAASAGGGISIFRPKAVTATSDVSETMLHELPGHDDGTNCIAWAPVTAGGAVSRMLASGGQDGAVKLWDADSGQHVTTAELGSAWVDHIAWRPGKSETGEQESAETGKTNSPGVPASSLLAAAAGKDVVFLNADGSERYRCKPAPKTVQAIAWEPDGGALAAAHFGGVRLWDGDDFVLQKELPYNNGIHSLVWSPDNRWLVSGNQDQSVHLWIPETGLELHMSGYESKVVTLAFDRNSQWLATGGGRDACVWNCSGPGPEGREPDLLPHPEKVCALAFQRTHGLLASASEDGSVMLWSLDRNQPLRATVKMPSAATKLAWTPDDRFLAIGSKKGAVYVLSVEA
ncbi:WD40 repeat protein [Ereboglobus sp. PH5-5]|uniref:WD40 repeat domain-containing protein n=1 Tax=Ereboglobus sp. PH5-5 TaxID=2940529 RepID=UPI002406061A|nr:WD40 repeat domain-containing protein [Ereboglobus sp. PH5-5]MDF9832904.1 WD40 repeat protein [Ereboglobus sp. PH5-5]